MRTTILFAIIISSILLPLVYCATAPSPEVLPLGVSPYGLSYYRVICKDTEGSERTKALCRWDAIDFCAAQDKDTWILGVYSYMPPIGFPLDPRFGTTEVEVFFDCVDYE